MKAIINDENQNCLYYAFETQDKNELLSQMSKKFSEHGMVKDSFEEAIIKREDVFPTGLPTECVSVAIPHTDAEHVIKPGVLIGVLKNPVTFGMMAKDNVFIDVELVFMLAIKDPNSQVDMLRKIIMLCQEKNSLLLLKGGKDTKEIRDILKQLS